MKIKTKRGARRTRNQRVITKRFITTDYTGCPYITAGKLYETIGGVVGGARIIDDEADELFVSITVKSHHLDGVGTWRYATI